MTECSSCHAPIEWATTERGKRMPVDAAPVEDGTILLRHLVHGEPPVAHMTTIAERDELAAQAAARGDTLRLFKSHFATCSSAARHRRR